jgi:hypothetical protein
MRGIIDLQGPVLRWIAPDIDGSGQRRDTPRIREPSRAEWSIPDDQREQRRVRTRLIVLAPVAPITQLLRLLLR